MFHPCGLGLSWKVGNAARNASTLKGNTKTTSVQIMVQDF